IPAVSLSARMENYERGQLREALREAGGNVTEAAELLHLPRKTLYDKLTRHRLDPDFFRK
ncbi:MAG: sigma-54-dependent Fis family transcriptional regulator, partial [Candidatus Accumulibacter sp.]|nr:sigma-54-dependent Fis family transcriptional regulator [Accumulibacter sp.]